MNTQTRQFAQALFFVTLICLLLFFFIISTQSTAELNYPDNPWYLNRGRLIWQGILPDLFVYTLAYPALVGLFDFAARDSILSGMLANGLALWLLLVGTYLLGRWLYSNERVARLAVLLAALHGTTFTTLRFFWPYVLFSAVVTWCVVACVLVIRRPGIATAVLLGVVLAVAPYTRFEGTFYSLLIPVAAWIVYRQNHNRRLALQILLTSAVTFAVLVMPFVLNFVQVSQNLNRDLSNNVTGIVSLLNRTPIEWPVIWRRATDTVTGLLYHWNSLAWLIGLFGVIFATNRYRAAQQFCAALVVFNVVYAFVLAIWPNPIQVGFYIPLFALILAAALDQLMWRGRRWKRTALALYALIILPGISAFVPLATAVAPLAYRTSEIAREGSSLDAWLRDRGLEQTRIYTFCPEITAFSRANFQVMYRLIYTTGWDTPERLVPILREQGALVMVCGSYINHPDWRMLFEAGTPPGLHEVGRFDTFVFYRPDDP